MASDAGSHSKAVLHVPLATEHSASGVPSASGQKWRSQGADVTADNCITRGTLTGGSCSLLSVSERSNPLL